MESIPEKSKNEVKKEDAITDEEVCRIIDGCLWQLSLSFYIVVFTTATAALFFFIK